MVLLLVLGLALTALSVIMAARLLVFERPPREHAATRIQAYGYETAALTDGTPSRRLTAGLDNLAATVGLLVTKRMRGFHEEVLRKELQSAGLYTMSPRKFIGYRLLSTVTLPALWLWYASTSGAGPLRFLGGLLFALAFGWQGPMVLLRRRSRKRLEEIDSGMPELIDLLVTTVEAGVAFSGSLRLAATRFHGALGTELRLAIQEQEMGLSTNEALANMVNRADTGAMRSFVRAILQGESLGVSIGKIMRDLAVEMRKRRRQLAEERVQKAPTKMIFPLVFLIFPGMFVVLLGPAGLQILQSIGGGK